MAMQYSFPDQIEALGKWLEENRVLRGFEKNKPWKEWWVLHKLVLRDVPVAIFPSHFVATHRDAPDFQIKLLDGQILSVDITEATTQEDRRAITLSRENAGISFFGDPIATGNKTLAGGRYQGGATGWAYEIGMADDIRSAIKNKSGMNYGKNSILLIYPNSNAVFAKSDVVFSMLEPLGADSKIGRAVILVSDRKAVICLCREEKYIHFSESDSELMLLDGSAFDALFPE